MSVTNIELSSPTFWGDAEFPRRLPLRAYFSNFMIINNDIKYKYKYYLLILCGMFVQDVSDHSPPRFPIPHYSSQFMFCYLSNRDRFLLPVLPLISVPS